MFGNVGSFAARAEVVGVAFYVQAATHPASHVGWYLRVCGRTADRVRRGGCSRGLCVVRHTPNIGSGDESDDGDADGLEEESRGQASAINRCGKRGSEYDLNLNLNLIFCILIHP